MSDQFIPDTSQTPAVSDITAPTPGPATQDPNAQPATQATPPVQATNAQPQVEPSWLRTRLEETRRAALQRAQQEWQQREQMYQQQLETVQRQLHALVGAAPQEDPEVAGIRQQLYRVAPELQQLAQLAQRVPDLMGLLERSGDIDAVQRHYWTDHGRRTLDRLYEKVSTTLGAPLNESGKRFLHSALAGAVSGSPELAQRYSSDPSFVDEFAAEFVSNLIDPVRRSAAATVQTQTSPQVRALPQDAPGGVPQITQPAQPKDLDERMKMGWAAYQTAQANRGR